MEFQKGYYLSAMGVEPIDLAEIYVSNLQAPETMRYRSEASEQPVTSIWNLHSEPTARFNENEASNLLIQANKHARVDEQGPASHAPRRTCDKEQPGSRTQPENQLPANLCAKSLQRSTFSSPVFGPGVVRTSAIP